MDLDTNVIEFTKDPNHGRYGYLIGVRDVDEEGLSVGGEGVAAKPADDAKGSA
ncbi:hypothetical protein H7U32_00770 [Bifidobacterium pullorum subsp. saeculare]|uniref:Uncharacterized protein n=1 Tax=Bifidobacterium pullorum subsp. saeculare TaxID=78257 RepID=A0A939B8Z0_9BIFI|nr:hypothetical protein [Bifidobacterium pullorum]MBM6698884.1 hypothetical protein [Bifidobacterium pullorum subsp. saeculare]